MKKIRIPRPRPHRSYSEKFCKGARPFGGGVKHTPPDYGSLPRLLLCMLFGTLLVVAILLLGKLWRVKEVTARDGRYYSSAVVLNQVGIRAGDEMLGFDGFTVKKRLKDKLPLLDEIRVRRQGGGRVSVSFTEVEALYYTCHNQNYYILDARTYEVLCISSRPDEAQRVGAVYLGMPACARLRVGERLTFVNLPYPLETTSPELSTYELETEEPEQENAYVLTFAQELMSSPLASRVVGMELGDRYDLWLVLREGIRIRVGGMEELERKLSVAERALQEKEQSGTHPAGLPVLLDVSDPARVIYRPSPDIELPDWALHPTP